MICETCGKEFTQNPIINGRKDYIGKRKNCLDCLPRKKGTYKYKDNEKNICKICKNPIDRSKVRGFLCQNCDHKRTKLKRKLKAIEYLGGKCSRCGFSGHPAALECHHAFGEKNFMISSGSGWEKIKEELDSCELLCANCHNIDHASYDEGFILFAIDSIKKTDGFVIENYEFIKDLTPRDKPPTKD